MCGGSGLVPKAMLELDVGAIEGKKLVPCTKCRKDSSSATRKQNESRDRVG